MERQSPERSMTDQAVFWNFLYLMSYHPHSGSVSQSSLAHFAEEEWEAEGPQPGGIKLKFQVMFFCHLVLPPQMWV